MKNKVFGIGFHKTGTTSLGKALGILGYNNCHGAGVLRKAFGNDGFYNMLINNDLDPVLQFTHAFDSFNDNPWYLIYKELDNMHPGSKFILSIRDDDGWLNSALHFFKDYTNPIREWIYGKRSIVGNEDIYLKRYQDHNKEVLEYFKDRPHDLLILDLADTNKWEKLCDFLDVDVPDLDYPYLNSSRQFPAK